MDTLRTAANSAVNTASNYLYGNTTQTDATHTSTSSTTEPVSGQEGKGTVSDPYDGGNKEDTTASSAPQTTSTSTEPTSTEPKSESTTSGLSSTPVGQSSTSAEHKSTVTGAHHDPSTGADPSSGQKPFQKQQGADRPTDAPAGEESSAVKESKDEGEEALKKRDPNDHSGEPMKMHDGTETKKEESGDHPGQEGGDKHGEKGGSGEEWIKTSGLKSDGGDFDAAQAGAGREADRLLGEKGIQKDGRGAMVDKEGNPVHPVAGDTDHSAGGHSSEGKVKTMDKLKSKLHIGSGKQH